MPEMPLPAPISHSPTLPRLSPADHALFNLFASGHLDLHTLADKSGRDLAELTAWAAAPEIRLYTEAYREIAGHALLNSATSALLESIRLTSDPIEKRRAATALLRALQTPRRSPSSPSGGGAAALSGGGGSVSTPPTQPPRATTSTSPPETPNTQRLSPSSPSGRGARAAGGEGSVSTPPTHPPRATAPTPPATPLLPAFSLPTPNSPLPTTSVSPFTSRPSPLSRLTTAAGLAGPAP